MSPSPPHSSASGPRLLVLVRHGKAEPFAEEDHQRVLTDRGARDAAEGARWLASHGVVPTHAWVSSAARTRGTWEAMAAELAGAPVEVHVDDSLYSGGPDSVLDSLRAVPEDASVVAYVGHNPTAASLAHLLDDGEPDPDAFRSLSEGFPTSAVAVLRVDVPWGDLGPATCGLVAFHVGRG